MQHLITGTDMNEVRARLEESSRLSYEGRFGEAAELYAAVIDRLPRDGTAQDFLVYAYEELISLRMQQRLEARAFRVLRQYVRDCAPACDPQYDQDYEEGLRATKTYPAPLARRDRFYSLVQLFGPVSHRDGLVAECGCYRGLSSFLLCRSLKHADGTFDGRGYRIFDSFAGLSVPQSEDTPDAAAPGAERFEAMGQAGHFAATLAEVRQALAGFPGIEFYPGWIPEAFPDEPTARYRFVHVDVDLYQPTIDSLEYFYPRLVPGGRIVSDDYSWPGARKALDEFSGKARIELTTNRLGQAWIERTA